MPHDVHTIKGKKEYFDDLQIAWAKVWEKYPGAKIEGSVGSWSATSVDGRIVAEAWMHARRPGWWVRILCAS